MAYDHLQPLAVHPNLPWDVAHPLERGVYHVHPLGMGVLHHQSKEVFYLLYQVEEETFCQVHRLERVAFCLSQVAQNPFHLLENVVVTPFQIYRMVISSLLCAKFHHDAHLVLAEVASHLPIRSTSPLEEANLIHMGAFLCVKEEPHWYALLDDMGVLPSEGHGAAILQFVCHFG